MCESFQVLNIAIIQILYGVLMKTLATVKGVVTRFKKIQIANTYFTDPNNN